MADDGSSETTTEVRPMCGIVGYVGAATGP